jgi:hypothetical protein
LNAGAESTFAVCPAVCDRNTLIKKALSVGTRAGACVGVEIATNAAMRRCVIVLACVAGGLFGPGRVLAGQDAAPVPLAERARGAERVVVGRVASVESAWRVNEFGDRLIVSTLRVTVNETLKGPSQPTVDVEVEGGTIGGVTLRVSDQEALIPGERAVFYLKRDVRGHFVPHLRGQGLLKLDRSDRVPNTSLTLETIRREARSR